MSEETSDRELPTGFVYEPSEIVFACEAYLSEPLSRTDRARDFARRFFDARMAFVEAEEYHRERARLRAREDHERERLVTSVDMGANIASRTVSVSVASGGVDLSVLPRPTSGPVSQEPTET